MVLAAPLARFLEFGRTSYVARTMKLFRNASMSHNSFQDNFLNTLPSHPLPLLCLTNCLCTLCWLLSPELRRSCLVSGWFIPKQRLPLPGCMWPMMTLCLRKSSWNISSLSSSREPSPLSGKWAYQPLQLVDLWDWGSSPTWKPSSKSFLLTIDMLLDFLDQNHML